MKKTLREECSQERKGKTSTECRPMTKSSGGKKLHHSRLINRRKGRTRGRAYGNRILGVIQEYSIRGGAIDP